MWRPHSADYRACFGNSLYDKMKYCILKGLYNVELGLRVIPTVRVVLIMVLLQHASNCFEYFGSFFNGSDCACSAQEIRKKSLIL